MNCNGYVPLLCQCENRIIILVIQGDLSIIGVDFDTVQAITVNGFYDCIYGLCRGVACVDVSKGIELGVYPEFCVNVLRECKQQKLV